MTDHPPQIHPGIILVDNPDAGDKHKAFMLRWRGVDDLCEKCEGSGVRVYGSSSTWRGGAGAAVTTNDVYDVCWGTDDKYRRGVDLRVMRDEEAVRAAKAAVDHLARSVGAWLSSTRGNIDEIVGYLRGFARKRGRNAQTVALSEALADVLHKAIQ